MFDLQKLLRDNIKTLRPYASARTEYSGASAVFLDANENAFGSGGAGNHHRYPDPLQQELKQRLSELKRIAPDRIFVGNGSDESIDLLLRAFCSPGQDAVIVMPPTYGMYAVSSRIHDVSVLEVPLRPDFTLDAARVLAQAGPSVKLIFLCSPNNPTGNCLDSREILKVLSGFAGIVVLDEAYIDFIEKRSLLRELAAHPNLVVLQTLSKAWGLAGVRVGMAFAHPDLIAILNRIKPPYNVSGPAQEIALKALGDVGSKNDRVHALLEQRKKLAAGLRSVPAVLHVYPSEANFLLVRVTDPSEIYHELIERNIVVRDRSRQLHCDGCLRITVGTEKENQVLLNAMEEMAA